MNESDICTDVRNPVLPKQRCRSNSEPVQSDHCVLFTAKKEYLILRLKPIFAVLASL